VLSGTADGEAFPQTAPTIWIATRVAFDVHYLVALIPLAFLGGSLTVRTNPERAFGGGTIERLLAILTSGLTQLVAALPDHRAAILRPQLLAERLTAQQWERSITFDVSDIVVRVRLRAPPAVAPGA